jgi:hypothetical protein
MPESKSPIICVTCRRSFPDDLEPDDAPRYFAQDPLLPRSSDEDHFVNEATNILGFIETITHVTQHCTEAEQKHHKTILELLFQLSEEAKRRLALADDAMRERADRDREGRA